MSDASRDICIEDCLTELVERFEETEGFDPAAWMAARPELAREVLGRFRRLVASGLVVPAGRPERLPDPDSAVAASGSQSGPDGAGQFVVSLRSGKRYQILDTIGLGGMGEVMRAFDLDLQREIALKIIRPAHTRNVERPRLGRRLRRFVAEARITARLEHPNIVPVHDIGIAEDGRLFYVMKLVHGVTLHDFVEQARPSAGRRDTRYSLRSKLEIVLGICTAVAYAHSRSVVHRDLKPRNVMIGEFGEVFVMDWGLARSLVDGAAVEAGSDRTPSQEAPQIYQTRDGEVVGTPSYMAPEQARGETRRCGASTDVFGIGSILHQLLTGNPPYWGGDLGEIERRARAAELNDREFSRSAWPVPRELRAVCLRALAAEPSNRYASAQALADDIRAFLDRRPGMAWRETPVSLTLKWVRRHPAFVLVVVAMLLAALVGDKWSENQVLAERNAELSWAEDIESFRTSFARVERLAQSMEDDTSAARRIKFCSSAVEPFKALGLDLEHDSVPTLRARLAEFRASTPQIRPDPARALLSVGRWLIDSRVALAYWHRASASVSASAQQRLSAIGAQRADELASAAPQLLATWEKIDQLIRASDVGAWRLRWWDATCASARFGEAPSLDGIHSEDPDDTQDVLFARIDLLRKRGERQQAIDLLFKLGDDHPGNCGAHLLLGEMLTEGSERDLARAEQEYRLARELDNESLVAHTGLGRVIMLRGDPARAHSILQRAVELVPDSPTPWVYLSWSLRDLGQLRASADAARRALDIEPGNPKALAQLGLSSYRSWVAWDDPTAASIAIEACRSSIEARVSDPTPWEVLVVTLDNTGQRDEAEFWARRGLEHFPSSSTLKVDLARILFRKALRDALASRTEAAERTRCEALCLTSEVATSEDPWSFSAIDASKEEAAALYNATSTLPTSEARDERWPEVAERLERVLACDPNDMSMTYLLGRAYFGLHRYDEAIRCLERSLDARMDDLDRPRVVVALAAHQKEVETMLRWGPVADPSVVAAYPAVAPYEHDLRRLHDKARRVLERVRERSAPHAPAPR